MKHRKLRNRLVGAASLGVAAAAITMLVGSGTAFAAGAPANPAYEQGPNFYNGNVALIRDSGSDTTFFMMQKIADLYTSAGLYGCTLNNGTGESDLFNGLAASSDNGGTEEDYCVGTPGAAGGASGNVNQSTTDTSDNFDRTEVDTGVDDVGSTAGQEQLCGTLNSPSLIATGTDDGINFSRSSKPAGTYCAGLTQLGYAKDGVPAVDFPTLSPDSYGSATYYNWINGGVIGPVADGWLPGDPVAGPYNGTAFTNLSNVDGPNGGGGANSTAYRLWCASYSNYGGGSDEPISDWGQLTNLGPNLELADVDTSNNSKTITEGSSGQSVTLSTSSEDYTISPELAIPEGVTVTATGTGALAANTTVTSYNVQTGKLGLSADPTTAGTATLSFGFPSAVANGDTVTGPGIPSGTTVSSGAGTTTLTLSKDATATSSTATLTFAIGTTLSVGQGINDGIPVRIDPVNTASGTEATWAKYSDGTDTSGGCSSNVDVNGAGAGLAVVGTGRQYLENNVAQDSQFAEGDFPGDAPDQAVEIATSLYFISDGVYNTNPYAGDVVLWSSGTPGTGTSSTYSSVKLSMNGESPTTPNVLNNIYPTARTLFNIYLPATVTGNTAGFLNWVCGTNTDTTNTDAGAPNGADDNDYPDAKQIDNSTGVNMDAELTNIIQGEYGFIRLTDLSDDPYIIQSGNLVANPTPADQQPAPNDSCAAGETQVTVQGTYTDNAGNGIPAITLAGLTAASDPNIGE